MRKTPSFAREALRALGQDFRLARKPQRLAFRRFCPVFEARRLAHRGFGLANGCFCLGHEWRRLACKGLRLAHQEWGLATGSRLGSGRGRFRGTRATGEAGTHLGAEVVQAGTCTEGFQDAVKAEAEDHEIAAQSHLGVIRLLRQRGDAGETRAQLVEVGEVRFLGGEVSGGIGGQLRGVLPSDDECLAAEGFAFVAHFGEASALFDGKVDQLCSQFRFEGIEGSINRGPVRVRDTQVEEVLCHGFRW